MSGFIETISLCFLIGSLGLVKILFLVIKILPLICYGIAVFVKAFLTILLNTIDFLENQIKESIKKGD